MFVSVRKNPVAMAAAALVAFAVGSIPDRAAAQLFESLRAFEDRLPAGDPDIASQWEGGTEGPKGLASGDLNQDGAPDLAVSNLDGTVTVFLNQGGEFAAPIHLRTETTTLRDVLIADLTGDGRNDIAAASLLDGSVIVFAAKGGGAFDAPLKIPTWKGARNMAVGDFDGDGAMELVIAGGREGLRQYRRNAEGVFQPVVTLPQFAAGIESLDDDYVGKPVFSLRTIRLLGGSKDELVVTHAESNEVCLLVPGANGALGLRGCIPTVNNVFAVETCPITSPIADGRVDLLTAHRDLGTIRVRKGTAGPERFTDAIHQEIQIPGGPRFMAAADLNGDGWNDLAVVLRNLDRVITYRNDKGTLVPSREMPVGQSPRELVSGDFNRDGQPDFAVVNRISADISILKGHAGEVGFSSLDQVYLVDGEVTAFEVRDFNGDGRDDVLQLHRASGDASVRLAQPDGSLGPPEFHRIGKIPADLVVEDVNNDGKNDMVVVSLGTSGIERGSVSVRLGDGMGGFGPEQVIELPEGVGKNAGLFSARVADFDGDGIPDLVAGYMDCRISFFKGTPQGRFERPAELDHPFTYAFGYEVRAMATGDFDRDGDIDLAGASMNGDVIVAENPGSLLNVKELTLRTYRSAFNGFYEPFPTLAMISTDLNKDGDIDLVVGGASGAIVYYGAAGMGFNPSSDPLPGTVRVMTSDIVEGDFDGDGDLDMVISCEVLSCIIVLTRNDEGKFAPALVVDVPAGKFIATGDFDGDGKADLAGTGDVLWTALSSRRSKPSKPPVADDLRAVIPGLVINELLAINNAFPIPQSGGRRSDWLEIFNGSGEAIQLAGHRLVLETEGNPPREYQFPAGPSIQSGAHLLLVAANEGQLFHTGFKLPGSGGTLTLLDAGGKELDRVQYPPQRENVAYSRYRDGIAAFVFSLYPSPEGPNADNGPIEPIVSLTSAGPASLKLEDPYRTPRPGEPIRFFSRGKDDVGLVNVSAIVRRGGAAPSETERVILYDDGMNDDGESQDGLFSGVLNPGIPAGGAIEFYLEATDLSGNTIQIPDGAFFSSEPGRKLHYSLAVGSSLPRLEISEFVTRNTTGLKDEAGRTADWIEIRNCSAEPISLAGISLADRFPSNEEWFTFPADRTLAPGQQIVVFCDGNVSQGPLHAPFRLGDEQSRLYLLAEVPAAGGERAPAVIDSVAYGPQEPDVAWGRPTCGGAWTALVPTPGQTNNVPQAVRGDADRSQQLDITDPIVILTHLFLGGKLPCPAAADVNSDAKMDVSDPTYLLNHLFLGGPKPPEGMVECP